MGMPGCAAPCCFACRAVALGRRTPGSIWKSLMADGSVHAVKRLIEQRLAPASVCRCEAVVQAGLPSCQGQCSGGLAACCALVFVMAVCSVGNVVRFVGAAVIAYVAVWQFHICRIASRYVSFHNPKRCIFIMCFSRGCCLWLSFLPEVVHVFSPYCPQSGVGPRTTAVECCFAGLSRCSKLIAIKLCAM